MNRLFDYIETLARVLSYGLTFLLVRVALVFEVGFWELLTPGEYAEEKLARSNEAGRFPNSIDKGQAEFLFALQEAATNHTDLQVRQLLTLCGTMLTLEVGLTRGNFRSSWEVVAVAGLLATLLLCIVCVQSKNYWSPEPIPELAGQSASARWYKDMYLSMKKNEFSNDSRVEVYKAARRWFLIAVCSLGASFVSLGGRSVKAASAETEVPMHTIGDSVATQVEANGATR